MQVPRAAAVINRAIQRCCGYRLNHIYASATPNAPCASAFNRAFRKISIDEVADIRRSNDPHLCHALSYEGAPFLGYALVIDGRIVSVAYLVDHTSYVDHAIWPLQDGEIFLAHIATACSDTGHGYASSLLKYVAAEAIGAGYRRVIATVWWRHPASSRAFTSAGWKRVGFSVLVKPLGLREFSWRRSF